MKCKGVGADNIQHLQAENASLQRRLSSSSTELQEAQDTIALLRRQTTEKADTLRHLQSAREQERTKEEHHATLTKVAEEKVRLLEEECTSLR